MKETKISKEINEKVPDIIFQWYQQEAQKRNLTLNELLQEIPAIIESLEERLQNAESEVIELTGMGNSY